VLAGAGEAVGEPGASRAFGCPDFGSGIHGCEAMLPDEQVVGDGSPPETAASTDKPKKIRSDAPRRRGGIFGSTPAPGYPNETPSTPNI